MSANFKIQFTAKLSTLSSICQISDSTEVHHKALEGLDHITCDEFRHQSFSLKIRTFPQGGLGSDRFAKIPVSFDAGVVHVSSSQRICEKMVRITNRNLQKGNL